MKNNKFMKLITVLLVCVFCINITAYAAEEEIELEAEETVEYVEDNADYSSEDYERYVEGIYNTSENARASLNGVLYLGKSGTTLIADYDTTYSTVVSRLGVKNVKLQYKSSLGIWYTLITLDDRYRENARVYSGSFTTTGTYGRVYRLKATHYANVSSVATESKANQTGEFEF